MNDTNKTMNDAQEIKRQVRDKYAEIALQDKAINASSCCGAGGCSTEVYNIMTDSYEQVEGYDPDADLGLGCGTPTAFAAIRPGDTVLDLGSGAGNDCFVARHATGPDGRVIGVDFTEEMIAKAKQNAAKLGHQNVEFRQGDIEELPLGGAMVDVVLSNCVLNLVPDKRKAFSEVLRVLKPGGHFSISDVVLVGELPEAIRNAAEMYAGCVSGALQESEYLGIIHALGFSEVTVQKRKAIEVPDDILANYLDADDIAQFRASGTGIFSITVSGRKPLQNAATPDRARADKAELKAACCGAGSSCC